MTPGISIVIPNWNGAAYIARCVAGTIQSARASGQEAEVIVVDDASPDRSADAVEQDFPSVTILRNPQNVGFGASVNRGAAVAAGEYVVLLNNDLVPRGQMIRELVDPLRSDPGLFGVSGKTVDWRSGDPNHVNMAARWLNGNFVVTHENSDKPSPTMFLQGGCCAMRRSEFLRIGGFSPLFAPGYWEDYDVSYLALKAGWRNLYSPAAIASHLGQGSMKRAHGSAFINALRRRNFFLFTWMNLSDRDLLNEHLGQLPATLFHATSSGDMNTVRGFFRALPAVSSVVRERERRRSLIRQTDSTVLKGFETHGCRRPEPDPKHLISGVV